MNINELILFLQDELKGVKFDDIQTHLSEVVHDDIKHIECRQIDTDVLDVDIDTGDTELNNTMNWTVTLRRIVMWYPIPKEYIDINRETLMADNVEVFPYGLGLVQSDVIKGYNGDYILKEPICFEDIDYIELTENFARGYSLAELCESIIDVVSAEDKLKVLETIKGFYKSEE